MAKKFNFEFVLSHQSVKNLIGELKDYQKELEKVKEPILNALADYTYERVLLYLEYSIGLGNYVPTHKLENSIKKSPIFQDMIRVYSDLAYAKYVEFGTGVTGSEDPHPKTSEFGWSYDENSHGDKGWVYQASDGNFYRTSGQEAHRFMYNAWLDLQENYMEIVKKVLRERGLIK